MFYKHQHFTINLDTKKVFDINNKELHITGNSYRVLIFLCENKYGTITDIGTKLDWAKDYDENNLRQYRYKIETQIGQKVIEYKNGIYTLMGDIEKVEELAKIECNTVLLHPVSVKSSHKFLGMFSSKSKKTILLAVVSGIMVLAALLYWPPQVKKSGDGLCHERGTTYYSRTKNFNRFASLEDCLESGGRLPKK